MVTLDAIKELRDQTNCPMMDVKKALTDANGDMGKAKTLLRERLGTVDDSKPDSGKEGLIALFIDNAQPVYSTYVIAEVGTDTDFAARNDLVIQAAENLVRDGEKDYLADVRSQVGENVVLRKSDTCMFTDTPFMVGGYVHHDRRSAAVVVFAVEEGADIDGDLMRSVAMHVVAAQPVPACISTAEVPEDLLSTERAFLQKKASESGKPEAIQQKIIEGGLSKFRASRALLEQPYVKEPTKKVKDILPQGVRIERFVRWVVGE